MFTLLSLQVRKSNHIINKQNLKYMSLLLFFESYFIYFPETGNFQKQSSLLKKRLWLRCFPVNFVKFLKTHFVREHLW